MAGSVGVSQRKKQDELPEWMQDAIPVEDEAIDQKQDELPEWMQDAIPVDDVPVEDGDGILLNTTAGLNDAIYTTLGAPVDFSRWLINKGIEGTNYVTGSEIDAIPADSFGGSESISSMFGAVGVPEPKDIKAVTPGERMGRSFGEGVGYTVAPGAVVGGLGKAGALTGKALDAGTKLFGIGSAPGMLASETLIGGASGLGAQAAMEAAPDEYDAAAALGGGLAGGGIGALALNFPSLMRAYGVSGSPIKRAIVGKADDPLLAAQRKADLDALGIEGTAGMVAGNERLASREATLATTRQGGKIQKNVNDAFDKSAAEFDRVVDGLSGATSSGSGTARTRQELGDMMQEQGQAVKDAGFARSRELYGNVTEKTKGIAVDGTDIDGHLKRLNEQKKALSSADKLAYGKDLDATISRTKAVVDDIKSGKADFDTLRIERTRVGEALFNRELTSDQRKLLTGLRDTLTKEMERTAEKAGPEAQQAFRKANNHYRRHIDAETGFGKKSPINTMINLQSPEKVAGWVMQQGKDGGTRINTLRRQIDRAEGKEAWDNLTANVVEHMGRKKNADGVDHFNGTEFVKQWNTLSSEAKDALFKGTQRQQYREDLDRLARISGNLQKYNKARNHSNTATHKSMMSELNPFDRNTLLGTALGANAFGPGGVALAIGGNIAAKGVNAGVKSYQAKLLTDPKTVKWLADIPKAEMSKAGLKAHVQKLRDMASREAPGSALAIAINEYLEEVGPN